MREMLSASCFEDSLILALLTVKNSDHGQRTNLFTNLNTHLLKALSVNTYSRWADTGELGTIEVFYQRIEHILKSMITVDEVLEKIADLARSSRVNYAKTTKFVVIVSRHRFICEIHALTLNLAHLNLLIDCKLSRQLFNNVLRMR